MLAVNLSAPFHTIRTVLPQMRDRNWGRIVNISSAYGLVGGVDRSSYIASKFGLIGLTKAVAMETAETAITCNAICPGFVLAPHLKKKIFPGAGVGEVDFAGGGRSGDRRRLHAGRQSAHA